MGWFTNTLVRIADNRLILRLASFDVFATFDAWHYGNTDLLRMLIRQPWLQRLPIVDLGAHIPVDQIAPLTITGMASAVVVLLALHARRHSTRLDANLARYREACEHAAGIERRLAAERVEQDIHPLLDNVARRSTP